MSKKYLLETPVPGYYTSDDAKNKTNKKTTVGAGSYYIFNEYNGMINLTSVEGVPGSWINPTKEEVINDVKTTNTQNKKFSGSASKLATSGAKDEVVCFIINLVTNTRVEFSLPSELSESMSASFDDAQIRGRSSPIRGYNSSGPRTLSYEINLHDDYCKLGLKNTLQFLKGLVYPEYNGFVRAPLCFIRLGNVISTKATVDSVGVSYEKPYRNGAYIKAAVSLEITTVPDTPYSASGIESGVDYASGVDYK